MTFLPIVHRELRIASRKRGTYISRAVVAGIVVALWLIVSGANARSMSTPELAQTLFWTYGILAMLYALLSGVFFTADSLSAERREGTLGLLFLTDLKGLDVVLGKLVATSWHGVYSLLVIVPVLALPLLMGGVSFAEAIRLVIILLSAMFYSLAVGLLVSTLCRRLVTTIAVAFLIVLGQCSMPWLIAALLDEAIDWSAERNPLILLCPFTSMAGLPDMGYQRGVSTRWWVSGAAVFWMPILTTMSLGAVSLGTACWLLPRVWRREYEPTARKPPVKPPVIRPPETGPPLLDQRVLARPGFAPRALLETSAYQWLALRDRKHVRWITVVLTLLSFLCLGFFAMTLTDRMDEMGFIFSLFGMFALHVLVKGSVALESSRRLSEDRQSGALELLLVTPVAEREVVEGELAAIKTTFVRPLLLIFGLSLAFLITNAMFDPLNMNDDLPWFSEIILYGALILWLDAKTLAHTGMLTGIGATRHHRAVLGTLARVLLPPWIGVALFFFLVLMPGGVGEDGFVFSMRGYFGFSAFLDVLLIQYAKLTLTQNLRTLAAGEQVTPPSDFGVTDARQETPVA